MPRTDDPTRNPEHPNLPREYAPLATRGIYAPGRAVAKELLTRIVRDAVSIDWAENPEAADIAHDADVLARLLGFRVLHGDDDSPLFL